MCGGGEYFEGGNGGKEGEERGEDVDKGNKED